MWVNKLFYQVGSRVTLRAGNFGLALAFLNYKVLVLEKLSKRYFSTLKIGRRELNRKPVVTDRFFGPD